MDTIYWLDHHGKRRWNFLEDRRLDFRRGIFQKLTRLGIICYLLLMSYKMTITFKDAAGNELQTISPGRTPLSIEKIAKLWVADAVKRLSPTHQAEFAKVVVRWIRGDGEILEEYRIPQSRVLPKSRDRAAIAPI